MLKFLASLASCKEFYESPNSGPSAGVKNRGKTGRGMAYPFENSNIYFGKVVR